MTHESHQALVQRQFGARAEAYVRSAVHAEGDDLRALAAVVGEAREARVLDLGCGGGHVSFRVAPLVAEVVAFDLSPEMLGAVAAEAARRGIANITTREGAVEALPFHDASFDFVLSRFSAHHWHDFRRGLREARRVLKKDGRAAFVDVVTPDRPLLDTFLQAVELMRDPSHVRDYGTAEWLAALGEAGFHATEHTARRLRLDFAQWVERMATPSAMAEAIRALQAEMTDEVRRHFAIEPDGSFTIDTMAIAAVPA